jgi:hypothetical protein
MCTLSAQVLPNEFFIVALMSFTVVSCLGVISPPLTKCLLKYSVYQSVCFASLLLLRCSCRALRGFKPDLLPFLHIDGQCKKLCRCRPWSFVNRHTKNQRTMQHTQRARANTRNCSLRTEPLLYCSENI